MNFYFKKISFNCLENRSGKSKRGFVLKSLIEFRRSNGFSNAQMLNSSHPIDLDF